MWGLLLKAQVITGQHDCKMRYVFLNPPATAYYYTNGSTGFYFDLDGDSQNDFKFWYFNSGGIGGNGQGTYIAPIGSGEIAYGWTDSAFSIGCNPQWRFYNRADTLNVNDSVNNNLIWYNSGMTFFASGYLMGGNPPCHYSSPNDPSYKDKYIGLRVFKNSDTLYGWIKMVVDSNSRLAIQEICCEVKPYAPLINSPLTNVTLNCGDTYSHPLNVIASTDVYYQWSKDGVEIPNATTGLLSFNHISPSDSGLYSCMVWNCFDTVYTSASISVNVPTVLQIDTPKIDREDIFRCSGIGHSDYLVVNNMQSNVQSYQWLKNGVPLIGEINDTLLLYATSAEVTGIYLCRVTVLINDYCADTSYTQNFTTNAVRYDVYDFPSPVITQIGNHLISNYSEGNSWQFATNNSCCYDLGNSQEIVINEDGFYALIVNTTGCSGNTPFREFFVQFTVTPNPFENEIIVSLDSKNRDVSWELINDLGITVLKGKMYSAQNSINTSTIAKGHYYLKINGQVMKMIKQ